jgi:hypothetical protein
MPFALIITGLVLLIAGVKGTQNQLYTLVKGDLTGSNNYIFWMLSILVIGALGYVPKLQPLSRIFLVLIVVTLLIHEKGFFAQFQSAVKAA